MAVGRRGEAHLILAIDSVHGTNPGSRTTRTVVTPARTPLPVWAVPCHVTGITTDATDYVGRVVLPLRALKLAVADLAAVLAGLVLIVSKGTVQGCQFAELVPLELILTFGD